MVAEGGGVDADLTVGDGVVKVLAAVVRVGVGEVDEAGVEARAGDEAVTGVEGNHGAGSSGLAVGDDGGQAVDAAVEGQPLAGDVAHVTLGRDQPGFLVADVQDGEGFGLSLTRHQKQRGKGDSEGFTGKSHTDLRWV